MRRKKREDYMRSKALALLICFSVPLCAHAETHSMFSFGAPRIPVMLDGAKYMVQVHKVDNAIMMQGALGTGAGRGDTPIEVWRRVAEKFVEPIGCGIPTVEAISQAGATWEATVMCPEGVNFHELVKSQKAALKKGDPLRLKS